MATHYLTFELRPSLGLKTKTFDVIGAGSGEILGRVRWYSHWRKYVFYPQAGCLFDSQCLGEIRAKIDELTVEWRAGQQVEKPQGASNGE